MLTHRNHYHCEECDISWSDDWTCACDDDCPRCGCSYTPHQTEDIGSDANVCDNA
jgi:transcription initiation factor IIE alpha subunit